MEFRDMPDIVSEDKPTTRYGKSKWEEEYHVTM